LAAATVAAVVAAAVVAAAAAAILKTPRINSQCCFLDSAFVTLSFVDGIRPKAKE
jgi:hypothetical protein